MKNSKKATSIAEAMIIILVVTVWIIWMYKIYTNSMKLSNSVNNKIQAIQIAKEWIEAFTNIRDTNWLIFSADYENCWNTYNYDNWCIWNLSLSEIPNNWHFKIYQDTDNRWKLWTWTVSPYEYSNPVYRNYFKIWLDSNWFYTHSWSITTEIKPIFTREIKTNYSGTWKIKITSLVKWVDSSSSNVHEVKLENMLSNWKD